jgi:hypothetical protein
MDNHDLAKGAETLAEPTPEWLEKHGREIDLVYEGGYAFSGRQFKVYYRKADDSFWALATSKAIGGGEERRWCIRVHPQPCVEIEFEFGGSGRGDNPAAGKILVEFGLDCGRAGSVTGLFVTTVRDLVLSIGKEAYFGEILGKHSEVYCTLTWDHYRIISASAKDIETILSMVGCETISGHNPLSCLREEEEE